MGKAKSNLEMALDAYDLGEPTFEGTPCKGKLEDGSKCGQTLRYAGFTGSCVACKRRHSLAYRNRNLKDCRLRSKVWSSEHREYVMKYQKALPFKKAAMAKAKGECDE